MKLMDYLNVTDRFANGSGARLTEVREGYARAELTVEERHLNAVGVCQGGALFTLADLFLCGSGKQPRCGNCGREQLCDVSAVRQTG